MLKKKLAGLPHIEVIQPYLTDADHVDIKTVDGCVNLREFIASMMSYRPWWLLLLYRIRAIVAGILRLEKQIRLNDMIPLSPEDISFTPGGNALFFIVRKAEEDQYLITEIPDDKHLRAYLVITVENMDSGLNHFHVITIVLYKHWTGPVYFNLIRPFHHLVVRQMIRAGVRV